MGSYSGPQNRKKPTRLPVRANSNLQKSCTEPGCFATNRRKSCGEHGILSIEECVSRIGDSGALKMPPAWQDLYKAAKTKTMEYKDLVCKAQALQERADILTKRLDLFLTRFSKSGNA
ncbi:ribosome-like protein [Bufonid herpesvirus 1]|uniref:ribosome-like protein n=1 Tax=Bufonid herpesvirus 1 TaxID=2282206 RepID=UPI000EB6A60B|nr:ribosome-like protein [Bufonid herpesvirus 1]AXF48538.1 ribosome-like protein [Bufonid herpesvirus 1]